MKVYLVGGAVRDKLLGLPIKERDWVVVGATVDEMLKLGYRQVGKEFPVFLHPKTNEEYALARMERKINPGYKGFTFDTSPQVTLEEDLLRRDLTINAMAETPEGELIDPYHGKADLDKRILRHVSNAFAEDPVRILRVGRFLARYATLGFKVDPATTELMKTMVHAGEVDALVPERVWKELERALAEQQPQAFFAVLEACGALSILFPDLSLSGAGMQALIAATNISDESIVRFAALFHALPNPKEHLAELNRRYRIPNAYRELALLTALHYQTALNADHLDAPAILKLFSVLDLFRRQDRFNHFLIACKAIAAVREQRFDAKKLHMLADLVKHVDVQALLAQGLSGQALANTLKEERVKKIAAWLHSNN